MQCRKPENTIIGTVEAKNIAKILPSLFLAIYLEASERDFLRVATAHGGGHRLQSRGDLVVLLMLVPLPTPEPFSEP